MIEMELAAGDFVQQLGHIAALERQVPAEQGVKDYTERPDIRLSSIKVLYDFWRHVIGCPCELCQSALFGHSCKAKVNQANLVIVCHHDVLRLDVSVNDVLSVAVVDRLKELAHVERSPPFTKALIALRSNLVEKWLSFGKFHHQVDVFEIIVRFEVIDDVRVVQCVQ